MPLSSSLTISWGKGNMMLAMRRTSLYWLAVALALCVLAYFGWLEITGPDPAREIDRKHRRDGNPSSKTSHHHDALGTLRSAVMMPVNTRASEADIIDGAEARLNQGAGTAPKYTRGSRLWKSNLGFTRLQSWGCEGRDCRITACKMRGGNKMYMGGTMHDRETNTSVSTYDTVSNAICGMKTFKNPKNAEWHNAWGFNRATNKYFFAKRRSCHDAGGC
jgi:hypothetical protein